MLQILLLVSLLWTGGFRQSGDNILFSASPDVVQPGGTVTLVWKVPDTFEQVDHVSVEMSHPILTSMPDRFSDLPLRGSLSLTVPADYYDQAVFRLYPEKADDTRYREPDGMVIFAEAVVEVDDGVEVIKLRADPNPAERNSGVLISWEVAGLDPETPSVSLSYYRNDGLYEQTELFPPVGTTVIEIPPYYTETFGVYLRAPDVMTGNTLEIDIRCPFDEYLAPRCPYTQENVELLYQRFENGALFRRGATVYALYDYSTYFEFVADDSVTLDPALTPPAGYVLPDAMFASVWLEYQEALGWAVARTSTYETAFETYPSTSGKYRVTANLFYLPTGELVDANALRIYWSVVE